MTHKSNLMKIALIGLFTLLMTSYTTNATAAMQYSKALEINQNQKKRATFKTTTKRFFESAKRFTTRKVRQLKKQYNQMSSVKKVAWGIGMILIGALVTIGSILTLSGWWFVIGLGLIIFGALKVVINILGIVV